MHARAPDHSPRLRDALLDLCFESGFRGFELTDLLARAGLERAEFEQCFAGVGECFLAVFEAEVERFQRESPPPNHGAAWRPRVRATLYALHRFLAADERLARFLIIESRFAGEATRLFAEGQMEALYELIDEGRAELAAPASISRTTAEALGGGIYGQIYAMVGRGAPLPPEQEIVPQLMYSVVLPYCGREAALEELAIPAPAEPLDSRRLGVPRG